MYFQMCDFFLDHAFIVDHSCASAMSRGKALHKRASSVPDSNREPREQGLGYASAGVADGVFGMTKRGLNRDCNKFTYGMILVTH